MPLLSASPKISEKFDPSKIKEILKEWVSFATETEKKDRERAFLFVYLAIHSLPIPKNEEDIWDLVPETDILESLRHLKTLNVILVEYVQFKIFHAHLRTLTKNALALFDIMTTYSAFAIVHKLCSRLKDLKLKGYGIGTSKILHHFDKNPGFFYSLGEDVIRFSEIQSYFNQINSENGKLFLIPNFVPDVKNTRSCDPIDLKNYLNRSPFHETAPELLCASFDDHIKYLLQFTGKKNDANTLANFWANKVAEEYSILEHFAGLAQFVRNQPCQTHTVVHKNNGMIHFAWTGDTFDLDYDYNEVVSPAVQSRSFVKPLSQNENDISITESESHNDLWRNQSDYQEFLKIEATQNSSIKMSSLINWIASNMIRLDRKEISDEILSLLLKPPHLTTAIREEPYLVKQLRSTFDEAIHDYMSKNAGHQTALFLIRASYLIEVLFLNIKGMEECETRIADLRQKILDLINNKKTSEIIAFEASLSYIYLFQNEKQINSNHLSSIISMWLESSFLKRKIKLFDLKKIDWLEYEARLLFLRHENILVEKTKDPEFLEACFAKISKKFNLFEDETWEGSYPRFEKKNVSVNIPQQQIYIENGKFTSDWSTIIMKNIDRSIPKHERKKFYLLCHFNIDFNLDTPFYYNEKKEELWSEDRSIHLFVRRCEYKKPGRKEVLNTKKWVLEKKFTIDGVETRYQYVDKKSNQGHFFYSLWIPCDPKVSEGIIHLCDEDKFFATFSVDHDKTMIFYRLDQNGNKTKETLSCLNCMNDKEDKINLFLKFFKLEKNTPYDFRIWQKEGKPSSIVIPKIFDLNNNPLEFKYREKRLEAAALPGYYLAQLGFHSFLFLKTALVLQNNQGDKKVLLPLIPLDRNSFKDKKRISYIPPDMSSGPCQYAIFDIDEKQEYLMSFDSCANLYLIIYLASIGDYENAIRYLEKQNPFHFYSTIEDNGNSERMTDRKLMLQFICLYSTFDPKRSAFILLLALHYIDNQNLRIAKRYENAPKPEKIDNLWEKILQHTNFLLETCVWKQGRHFPHYLSLTFEDFKKLKRFIDQSVDKSKIENQTKELKQEIDKFENFIKFYRFPWTYSRNNWERQLPHDISIKHWLGPDPLVTSGKNPVSTTALHMNSEEFEKQFITIYHDILNDLKNKKDLKLAKMKLVPLLYSQYQFSFTEKSTFFLTLLKMMIQQPENFSTVDDQEMNLNEMLSQIGSRTKKYSLFQHLNFNFNQSRLLHEATPSKKTSQNKEPLRAQRIREKFAFPLEHMAKIEFFTTRESIYQANTPFVLDDQTATPLEKKIYDDLVQGHLNNTKEKIFFYSLKEEHTLDHLETTLSTHVDTDRQKAGELKAQIEKAANKKINKKENVTAGELAQADVQRLKRMWQRQAKMDFARHILPAFMMQDAALLKKHNPHLTDAEIKNIFNLVADYMLIISRVDQANEAKQKIKKGESVQAIGEVLHKQRLYNPLEYPEFLVYEYASGFMLRESQIKLLMWILKETDSAKRKELLVEFQAGGGKTKVISAILIFLAYKQGKLPVFYSLPSLHDITKNDLREALGSIFNLKLAVLEFRLTTKLSNLELKGILKDLHRWKKEGYALQVTPEVYHALYLNYQFALRSEDAQRIEVTQKIRQFFLKHGYFIIDEAHRNTTSLWQANMTTGEAIPLKKEEQDLFVMCYKALTGNTPEILTDEEGRNVHELLQIASNQQAKLLPADLPKVLRALARWVCVYYTVEPSEEIIRYLTTKTEKIPNSLHRENSEKVDLLFLTRGILTEILPITLSLVGGFDHGGSIRETDAIESPRYGKAPTTSQYETAEIAAALCNQGLYQRGVDVRGMKNIFEKLLSQYNLGDQSVDILFNTWTSGTTLSFSLKELNSKDTSQMLCLVQTIGKNPAVIEHYLRFHLLPQIKIYTIKLTSTAPALVDGCISSILVSATIGRKEEYPKTEDQKTDLPFQAAVIQRLLSRDENSELHWVDTANPKTLYECLYQKSQDNFDNHNIEGIIDVGGINIRYSTEHMAMHFLDFAKEKNLNYFGALFIQEETGSSSDMQQLTLIKQETREIIPLEGSDLYAALKKKGIEQPENLNLFKVYGPTQCTGTDLQLTPHAKMLVTFSESTSLWGLIQALMRMRGFIKPLDSEQDELKQSCILVGPKKLKAKMPLDASDQISRQSVVMYALSKEAQTTEERIVARAFQQIAHEYRKQIDQKLMEASSSNDQISLYKKHVKAFEDQYSRDLQALFGNPECEQETRTLLEDFSNNFRRGAHILDWQQNKQGCQIITQVIRETAALVPRMRQKKNLTNTSTHTGEQKIESVGEQENQNKALRLNQNQNALRFHAASLRSYAKESCSVTSPTLTKQGKSANAQFETHIFSKELYFLPDALQTVTERDVFLKNLEYMLIVFENGKHFVYLASRHDAEIYQQQLLQTKSCSLNRKAALFTSQGLLAQNGKRALAIPEEKIQEIQDSLWMRKLCTDIALLNGKIYDFSFFERLMTFWITSEKRAKAFMVVYNRIFNAQTHPEEAHSNAVEYYLSQAQLRKTTSFLPEDLDCIESADFRITEGQEEAYEKKPPFEQKNVDQIAERQKKVKPKNLEPKKKSPENKPPSNLIEENIDPTLLEPFSPFNQQVVKRNINILPIVGGLMLITSLALALITGGWGAAAYFAPIHLSNIWIYVSLGTGGGLSLILFLGGFGLAITDRASKINSSHTSINQ
ncbi:MAG: DUF3638 domain-containing protein [Chlamydiia bacterium]|nr:DUF3638 domain-containing protein [Chlamydiia bacterium]